MKVVKFFLAALVLAAGLFGTGASVYAATNDDVINSLKAAKVDQVYITKAENYLKSTSLTSAQLDTINAEVKKVQSILVAANTQDVTKLSSANKNAVMNSINTAAQAANLTVTYAKDAQGYSTISLKDSSGNEVMRVNADEKGLKVTGTNYVVLLALGGLLLLAAAGMFAGRRKHVFAN